MFGIKTAKSFFNFYKEIFRDFIFYKYKNNYIHFDNIFYPQSVDKESITVGNKKIYALKLDSYEDIAPFFKMSSLSKEFIYSKNAVLDIFFVKNKIINAEKAKKVSVYIFSKNLNLLKTVASFFNTEFLSGNEIIKAIFDIVDYNEYYIRDEDYMPECLIKYDGKFKTDITGFNFKRIFAEAVYKNAMDCKLYQFSGFQQSLDELNMHSLLKNDFRGYFHIYINFYYYAVKNKIHFLCDEISKFEKNMSVKKDFYNFKNIIDNKEFNDIFCILNISALLDKESSDKAAQNIAINLNSNVFEKKLFKKDILFRTPVLERDVDFDFFSEGKNADKFISVPSRTDNLPFKNSINITGFNLINNYVTFSLSESASPHTIIFAKTRSGKSFFLQKAVAVTIKYDAETQTANALENSKIRYFDKGLSALKFVSSLEKNYPRKVKSIHSFKNLYFNFFDLKVNEFNRIDEMDLMFAISVANIFLEMNKTKTINAEEEFHLKEAINNIYIKKKYDGVPLKELAKINGYAEIVEKIYKKYPEYKNKNITTKELNDDEFSYLNKPRIRDIINYLELKKRNSFISNSQKAAIGGILNKLNIIGAVEKFQYYSTFNAENLNFFYMDIDEIEKLGEKMFVPVFWFLFYKFYKLDLENAIKNRTEYGKRGIPVYYIIEEAHNYMRYASLGEFFEKLSREAAKYNITLIFISQFISDLPDKVIGNLSNKIILPAPAENSIEQIKELSKIWEKKPEYLKFFEENKQRYTAFIEYDGGMFTLKPVITKEESWLFDSEK